MTAYNLYHDCPPFLLSDLRRTANRLPSNDGAARALLYGAIDRIEQLETLVKELQLGQALAPDDLK